MARKRQAGLQLGVALMILGVIQLVLAVTALHGFLKVFESICGAGVFVLGIALLVLGRRRPSWTESAVDDDEGEGMLPGYGD